MSKYAAFTLSLVLMSLMSTLGAASSYAADAQPAPAATPAGPPAGTSAGTDDTTNAERVDTENIKQKYWARGDESEMGVVQNRTYSKAHKFEFQILGGMINSDPFVSTQNLGARLGYHFNEYFSAHILAWKSWARPSSTQNNLLGSGESINQIGTALNTDYANYYYGGEFQASLLYGKLSLLGAAIIHYDLHLLAGLGATGTESGTDFTQHIGVGQQFYVSKSTSIVIDYRLMHYNNMLINKSDTANDYLGVIPGSNTSSWSNVFTIGFGILFGGPKQ
jgi:outer membrane beta-barrel protein